jgi:hypothetical protein
MIATCAALVPALGVLSALAVVLVAPSGAGTVPDAVQMAVMRYAVAETPLVRVRGSFGTQWAHHPLLDSSGVTFGRPLGGRGDAMRITVAGSSQIEAVPWNQISSIETDRAGSAGRSTLIGGAIGLAVGMVIGLSRVEVFFGAPDQTGEFERVMGISTASGLALGFLIGQHGRRRTIYPPREVQ